MNVEAAVNLMNLFESVDNAIKVSKHCEVRLKNCQYKVGFLTF